VRRAITALALTAALVPTAPAAATEGPLYVFPASVWATSPWFTASVLGGPAWQVQAPALSPAPAGNHWEMNWGCPVPGSEIAAVRFGALRTQAASSLAVRVTGDRAVLWQEGDAAMPQSPAPGRGYDVGLPHGQCNVHLALTQVEARNQHARGYFIDNPRIVVRDLTAPAVSIRSLSGGWHPPGSALHVDWSVGDNFGADGVGAQRIIVAGQVRWTGAPGTGGHAVAVGLDGVPDGTHVVQVAVDGDGTGGASDQGTISVDRTPPALSGLQAAPTDRPGTVAFAWTASDGLSGVATAAVEVNTAVDGGAGGRWEQVASVGGAGHRTVTATAPGIPDGVHAWRVRAMDVAGNVAVTPAPAPVVVDTSPPRLDVHGVPIGWVGRGALDLSATDDLEAAFGPVAVEVDVNAAADGGESGEWQRRASSPGPAGRRIVPLDLTGLAPGRHALRIVARNGGPLAGALATERRAVIRVDHERPTIARATFAGGAGRPVTVSWIADDAHAGVASATLQWRDAGGWRTLATDAAGEGAGTMLVDVGALPRGERALRLVVADGAGNVASRTGSVDVVHAGGVGSTAVDPLARLGSARLALRVDGGRAERRAGRRMIVRRIVAGRTLTIRGRLLTRGGGAIAGSEVQARGYRGRLVGRALTRRDGSFTLVARPIAGGVIRVGVLVRGRLLPRRAAVVVRAEVRPRLAVGASSTTVGLGQPVLFSGRITPAPAAPDRPSCSSGSTPSAGRGGRSSTPASAETAPSPCRGHSASGA
jgi:hypothetical protein